VRIGIVDPYLDTLGGGEKYILTMAECLSKENDVFFFWDRPETIKQGAERFNLQLDAVKTTKNIFSKSSVYKKYRETRNYDLIIYISDGSIPFLFAKKNILLFQFPVNWINTNNLLTKMKLQKIDALICYSKFVKNFLEKTFDKKIYILTPPIDNPYLDNIKKENIILTVGRFTQGMNAKKQEVMIEAFKKLYKELKNWKFVLLGGVLPQDESFVERLKEQSQELPIEIMTNIPIETLREYYRKSKIYWHATGYGEDLMHHPEYAEHFGIATVEAMSYGSVPVVINAGGQPEIVDNTINGYLWNTEEELIAKTKELIGDKKAWQTLSHNAQEKAKTFTKEKFCKKVLELL
jgi:glycosyltransferase involved in cell wall biosynthesis